MPHRVTANCINCLLGLLLQISTILGVPYYTFKCNHKNKLHKFTVRFSKFSLCSSALIIAFLLYSVFDCTNNIIKAIETNEELFDLICLFPNLSISIGVLGITLSTVLQGNQVKCIINKFEKLINFTEGENRLEEWIPEAYIKKCRNFEYFGSAALLGAFSLMTFVYCCIEVPFTRTQKLGHMVCVFVGGVFFALASLLLYICTYIVRNFESLVIEKLETKRKITGVKKFQTINFCKWLRSQEELYKGFIHGVDHFVMLINPALIIWLLATVVVYICCTYLLIMCFLTPSLSIFNIKLFAIEYIIISVLIFFVVLIYQLKLVQESTRTMLSYLYKFPLSKLNREEADQLESLMMTLSKKKMNFHVSHVFSLNLSIFAAMLGTTLTYSLTIINFQLKLNKY